MQPHGSPVRYISRRTLKHQRFVEKGIIMQEQRLRWAGLLIISMMLVGTLGWAQGTAAQENSVTFPQTGKTLRGGFLSYWQTHGGLAQQGYPITDEFPEQNLTNGQTYTTQYFERSRFEFHPENQDPNRVLLGLLGKESYQARYANGVVNPSPPVVPGGGSLAFPQTGHSVTGLFLSYWQTRGGLAQQGYPITDAFFEVSQTNGNTYLTQYFERARFEYHPEQASTGSRVLLGLLGNEAYQRRRGGGNPTLTATPQPGPTNTATTQRITQVTAQGSIGGGSTRSVSAVCPGNSLVLGGGWDAGGIVEIYASLKQENSWRVSARNIGSGGDQVTAYAYCLSGTSGSVSQEEAGSNVASGATGRAFVGCGNGVLTGGGFSKDLGINVNQAGPARDGWLVSGRNNQSGSLKLTGYAICLSGVANLNVNLVDEQISIGGRGNSGTTARCPDGSSISGGGFDTDLGVNIYASRGEGNGWRTAGVNTTSGSVELNTHAFCVKLP